MTCVKKLACQQNTFPSKGKVIVYHWTIRSIILEFRSIFQSFRAVSEHATYFPLYFNFHTDEIRNKIRSSRNLFRRLGSRSRHASNNVSASILLNSNSFVLSTPVQTWGLPGQHSNQMQFITANQLQK